MKVIGLTGSIGMGKSRAARLLRSMGVPVHDADATVHRAMGPCGQAVSAIEAAFPGIARGGAVDRAALGALVFADVDRLRRLEAILHPIVREAEHRFLRRQRLQRRRLVVLDIPLLFETRAERRCDAVIVVSAPAFLQAQRVLSRPGMTPERLAAIRAQQMPDVEKRRRADVVIRTGLSVGETRRALGRALRAIHKRRACRRRAGH
ncbi:MAG: dephospho-CoA kinase [Alphaproteobacteria bacterium]|nr:dephospho-CoA kinase [Alphaproteobacteria bacterium]